MRQGGESIAPRTSAMRVSHKNLGMDTLVDAQSRDSALTALYYLGQPEDLSSVTLFRLLSNPQPDMALRDLEPPLG